MRFRLSVNSINYCNNNVTEEDRTNLNHFCVQALPQLTATMSHQHSAICVHMHQCTSLQHNIQDVYTCTSAPVYNTICWMCTHAPVYSTIYMMCTHAPVHHHKIQYIGCVHMHQCTSIQHNIYIYIYIYIYCVHMHQCTSIQHNK